MKKNILALLITVICIITSGCATENRVIALIEKEDYAKAQEVYSATPRSPVCCTGRMTLCHAPRSGKRRP